MCTAGSLWGLMVQVNDLTAAVRWLSGNIPVLGFDTAPEVYMIGHSSGAHITLLFLIRQAKEYLSVAETGASAGDGSYNDGDGVGFVGGTDSGKLLEVEGFVGLSGVYDVHRHYLFESWR